MGIRIISSGVTAIALTRILCMLQVYHIQWVHPSYSVACLGPCLIVAWMTLGTALRAVVASSSRYRAFSRFNAVCPDTQGLKQSKKEYYAYYQQRDTKDQQMAFVLKVSQILFLHWSAMCG